MKPTGIAVFLPSQKHEIGFVNVKIAGACSVSSLKLTKQQAENLLSDLTIALLYLKVN